MYTNIHKFPFASASGGKSTFVLQKCEFSEMTGMQHLTSLLFRLLLRLWDLSYRVERQKLMVKNWEEMFVRFWKGGFVANLLYDKVFVLAF